MCVVHLQESLDAALGHLRESGEEHKVMLALAHGEPQELTQTLEQLITNPLEAEAQLANAQAEIDMLKVCNLSIIMLVL